MFQRFSYLYIKETWGGGLLVLLDNELTAFNNHLYKLLSPQAEIKEAATGHSAGQINCNAH